MSTAPPNPLLKPVKLALIQLKTGSDKTANLTRASEKVAQAAKAGANIVVLPECFNSPYGCEHFPKYAEALPSLETAASASARSESQSYNHLSALSKEHSIHLIAGSIPELEPATEKLYNTSLIFSPTGALLAKHRKVHLFDIDIPGKITFRESEVLTAGDALTLVETPYGKVGVGICYDVRFPEMAMIAARRGAFAMVYPGAFNMTTGPLHWELLARARAVDNQVWVAMCSPARELEGTGYVAWGESMVVDPNGLVMEKAGPGEETVMVELMPERIAEVRSGIPVGTQRRFDVYTDVSGMANKAV
ncbi:carbon-nitrogen hydrolase [Tricharina praecox]|uniref:carbon-nitrogen hydrolase n=1 Tax=Tricharina praecox TaxID=43433 RepID=UPI002220F150|nr:carbon-nitrogen hydrolase [Tricharina praecox]KAI5859025.1 carbon-nitrogen hydrolase [Tricharina praecox]